MLKSLFKSIKGVFLYLKDHGFIITLQKILALLGEGNEDDGNAFDFVLLPPAEAWKPQQLTGSKYTINWYVPDFDVGSGGHTTIFRIAALLEDFGHQCRIILTPPSKYTDRVVVKRLVNQEFIPALKAEFYFWGDKIPTADICFATSWHTAYFVNHEEYTKQKYYFIQDYEPLFYPLSSEYFFVENTYKFGFKGVTAGPWLAKIINDKYKLLTDFFPLAYDPKQYYLLNCNRKKKSIVFYARHMTPRRAFDLGILALKKLKERLPDVEIILYGANTYPHIPFPCLKKGILNSAELCELYNTSTLGLVLSLTNYSLIPNEMMACQMCVVSNTNDSIHLVYRDGVDICLVDSEPAKLASAMACLIEDSSRREKLAANAYKSIKSLNWQASAQKIDQIIRNFGV